MTDSNKKGTFAVREGEIDGHPLIVIVDMALKDYRAKACFPWHLTFTILLEDQTMGQTEAATLNKLQDELRLLLEGAADLQYIGRTTIDGIRKVHFYLDAPEVAHSALTACVEEEAVREFEYQITYDASWSEVEELFADS